MRWLKRVLFAFAALILLLIVGLLVLSAYERAQVTQFYEAHPMLRTMNELPNQPYEERELRMAEILLKRLPLGSARSHATQVLTGEGFICRPASGPDSRRLLVCSVENREPALLIPRWHIEVKFDEDDRVSGGRVLKLKATQ